MIIRIMNPLCGEYFPVVVTAVRRAMNRQNDVFQSTLTHKQFQEMWALDMDDRRFKALYKKMIWRNSPHRIGEVFTTHVLRKGWADVIVGRIFVCINRTGNKLEIEWHGVDDVNSRLITELLSLFPANTKVLFSQKQRHRIKLSNGRPQLKGRHDKDMPLKSCTLLQCAWRVLLTEDIYQCQSRPLNQMRAAVKLLSLNG